MTDNDDDDFYDETVVDAEDAKVDDQPEFQPINRAQFRGEVRELIDYAAQSGMSADDVADVLDELADGVPYFYEDLQRYAAQPDE